jgi:predicted ATPase
VGRTSELQQLHASAKRAWRGSRQVVFLTGEAGIGKTTLIEAFLASLGQPATSSGKQSTSALTQLTPDSHLPLPVPWIARGQCTTHYGASEAYLPVLDALQRLCREPGHDRLLAILNQRAPLWLLQMPSLLSPHERGRLQREVRGATPERMLREIAEALEGLTAEVPLVFVLEDLQWSDYATIDFLTFLATRTEPARLLILASYRPEEFNRHSHPLKTVTQELFVHGRAQHLPVPLLPPEAIAHYLTIRFPEHAFPPGFADTLHRRTEGNPFFLTSLVEHLHAQGDLAQPDQQWRLIGSLEAFRLETPTNIQDLIEHQIDHLHEQEEEILKAASAVGVDFSTAAAAAGLQMPVEVVEEHCEHLARRQQFLRARGAEEWPDGTLAARYQFLHSLYQQFWYTRITAARRVQLHRRIGDRKEQGYGDRALEHAAELAVHFEHGREARRAIHYHRQAAHNAARRFGYREAEHHLTTALALLPQLSDSAEHCRQEIGAQNALGAIYTATHGYAAPEVAQAYGRAAALCQQVEAATEQAPALRGLWAFNLTHAHFQTAHALAQQLLLVAEQTQSSALLLEAERELGQTCYFLGTLPQARHHLEQSVARYDPQLHVDHIFLYGQDPKVVGLAHNARALCLLGHQDHAQRLGQEAIDFARTTAHPYTLALAYYHAAVVAQTQRDWRRTHALADATLALTAEHGFPYWQCSALVLRGWALVQQGQRDEGLAQMQEGLTKYNTTNATLNRPDFLMLLAEAHGARGHEAEGLALLEQALTDTEQSGGNCYHAEMLRLKGVLLLAVANKAREGLK